MTRHGIASDHVVPCRATVLYERSAMMTVMHKTVSYFQKIGWKAMERAETAERH